MSLKRVIIIGGSYAGFSLARSLDGVAEVTLIEPRDRFVHNVAAMRAIVEPKLFEKIAIPYDRLLKRGKVVRARAVEVTRQAVKLSDGRSVEGDIIVVATGSTYASPFKPKGDDVEGMITSSLTAHRQLAAAKSVAIVGAGAVGSELAGEIATGMRGKAVTLISSTPTLFPGFTPGLGRKLEAQLKSMGMNLRLGATARALKQTDAPFAGRIEMNDGTAIDADLIFPVIGTQPVTDLLRPLPGIKFDKLGRAEVDGWLRPSTHPNVFALGDAISVGDGMTIVAIMRQQPWLTKTIRAVLAGKKAESFARYTPWPSPPILIPLGAKKGASVLPLTRRGVAVGPFLTSTIKGKELFIPRYQKEFGRRT